MTKGQRKGKEVDAITQTYTPCINKWLSEFDLGVNTSEIQCAGEFGKFTSANEMAVYLDGNDTTNGMTNLYTSTFYNK